MKFIFIIISSFILYSLNASEINKELYPHIQPISVEELEIEINDKDTDGDGVTNEEDVCPGTPAGTKVDYLGCKLLHDTDNDGIPNRVDKCPKTKEGASVDITGCAPDSDNDGVPDETDECPDTSSDFVVDTIGCPQTAILKVNFKMSKHEILKESLPNIKIFAEFLQENIGYQAIIYGFTDSRNKLGKNKELSQNRANAVMNALIGYGVKLTRLTAIGMGCKDPIADNETAEGRAKNRRIEVELLQ